MVDVTQTGGAEFAARFGGDVYAMVNMGVVGLEPSDGIGPVEATAGALDAPGDLYVGVMADRSQFPNERPIERGNRHIDEAIASVARRGLDNNAEFETALTNAGVVFEPQTADRLGPNMVSLLRAAKGERKEVLAETIEYFESLSSSNPGMTRYVVDRLLRFTNAIVLATQNPQNRVFQENGLVEVILKTVEKMIRRGGFSESEGTTWSQNFLLISASVAKRLGEKDKEREFLGKVLGLNRGNPLTTGRIHVRISELLEDRGEKLRQLNLADENMKFAIRAQRDALSEARVIEMRADVLRRAIALNVESGKDVAGLQVQYVDALLGAANLYYQHTRGLRVTIEVEGLYHREARCLIEALKAGNGKVGRNGIPIIDGKTRGSIATELVKAALISGDGDVMVEAERVIDQKEEPYLYRDLVRGAFEIEVGRSMRDGKPNARVNDWLAKLEVLSADALGTSQWREDRAGDVPFYRRALVYLEALSRMGPKMPRVGFDLEGLNGFKAALADIFERGHDPLLRDFATDMLARSEFLDELGRGRGCRTDLHIRYFLASTEAADRVIEDSALAVANGGSPLQVGEQRRRADEVREFLRRARIDIAVRKRAAEGPRGTPTSERPHGF